MLRQMSRQVVLPREASGTSGDGAREAAARFLGLMNLLMAVEISFEMESARTSNASARIASLMLAMFVVTVVACQYQY